MIKWGLRIFLVCVAAITGVVAWLLLSTSGLQVLFNQITDRVEGLRIESVEGRLIGPIRVAGLRYTATNGSRIELQSLDLDWRPGDLWSGVIKFTALSASGLAVIPGSEATQEPKEIKVDLPEIALPINIEIDHFDVTHIRISDVPIHSVTGNAKFVFDRLSIRDLRIEAPQGSASLRAELQARGKYPLQANAEVELKSRTEKTIHIIAAVSGDIEQLKLESNIADQVRLTGQLRHLTTAPGWNANVRVDGFSPSQFDPGLPPGSLNGELETHGDLQHAQVTGMLSAIGTELGDMEFHLNATGNERVIRLQRLDLTHRDIPGKLQASGTIDFSGALNYRFDASWRELRWLGAQGNGDLELQGSADQLTADLQAGFDNSVAESGLATAPIFAHLEVTNMQSKRPRIMLDARAEQLAYANYKLAGLIAKADVDLADRNPSNLEIRSTRFEIGEQTLKDLTITGSGTMHRHQVNAQLSHALRILNWF